MEERLKTESSIISFWLMAKPELASGVSAFREENSAAGGVFIYGIATAYKENRRETVAESPFYDYYPYGKQISLLATAGELTRPGFTGKEFDTEGATDSAKLGIAANYFGARYYDPEVGIWTTRDPVDDFWSPYQYPSNPAAFIDPNGLAWSWAWWDRNVRDPWVGNVYYPSRDWWNRNIRDPWVEGPKEWIDEKLGGAEIGVTVGSGEEGVGAYYEDPFGNRVDISQGEVEQERREERIMAETQKPPDIKTPPSTEGMNLWDPAPNRARGVSRSGLSLTNNYSRPSVLSYSNSEIPQRTYSVYVADYAIQPNAAAMTNAGALANYLGRDLTITSGYRPNARGAHGAEGGNAFDLGYGANGRIPRPVMTVAYYAIFDPKNSMAIQETGCYHFQLQPGRGGATGFLPGLRDYRGFPVKK